MVVGVPAWHRLGTVLDKPATAEQAIQAAHLDWSVTKQPVFIGERAWPGDCRRYGDLCAIVRDDLWRKKKVTVLGFASEQYTPLQNRDAFSFFDTIVGQNAAVYHTAGALGEGERVWILAKLPGCIRIAGDDITEKYLLLSNTHGGSGSVEIKFTPIRVVCQNTLTLAMSDGPALHIPHTTDLTERLTIAARVVNVVIRGYRGIEGVFREMAGSQLGRRELRWYLNQVFPDPKRPDFSDDETYENALAWARADRHGAEYLFYEGKGNREKGVAGTLWAAYNGVTEYVDHRRYLKATPEKCLEAIWFGGGSSFKERAYTVAAAAVAGREEAVPPVCPEALRQAGRNAAA